jgi:tRNA(adenine34) deaminase
MNMSTPTEEDLRYMRRAIELARIAAEIPGASPIGCVIVRDGQILGEGHNEVDIRHDPTAHAEIVTMQRVGRALGSADLRGATLYSTLQPCGMCSMASIWGKIGRIVYGAGREDVHRMYFDDLALVGGILAEECAALYYGPDDNPPPEDQGNI